MIVLASLVLGFAMLDALCGLDPIWLHPTPMRPCLGVTTWDPSPDAGLLCAYTSLFYSVRWYACHACLCHLLAFYASLHACLHVHAWVLLASVSSILQHNEDMDTRSKPTFVPHGHHLLLALLLAYLLGCLLSCSLAFLFVCLSLLVMSPAICYACHIYLACFLCTLCALSMHLFLSIACLLVSCSCFCMYTHEARTHRVRARSPRHKQNGWGCNMSI